MAFGGKIFANSQLEPTLNAYCSIREMVRHQCYCVRIPQECVDNNLKTLVKVVMVDLAKRSFSLKDNGVVLVTNNDDDREMFNPNSYY